MAATAEAVVPARKSLVQKLAEVMGEVERVAKSGRNEFHRYDYATEADIVASVRGGMAARGVMLIPSIEKIEWTERAMSGKAPMKIATLTVKFTFLDGDSEQKIEFFGMGQGEDASDKAIYKAMTGAEKYALLKTFLIPTGDDPEEDRATPPAQGKRPAPPQVSAKDARPAPASQPKPRPAVVDVKPGETEAQATARTLKSGAVVVGETTLEREGREKLAAAAKEPAPWERLEIYCREQGFTAQQGWDVAKALVEKGALPKFARRGDLDAPSLALVVAELSKAKAAKAAVEKQLNSQTAERQPGEDDVPF